MSESKNYNNFNCKITKVTIEVYGVDQQLVIDMSLLDVVNGSEHDVTGKSFEKLMDELL